MPKPHILIATPTADFTVTVPYLETVAAVLTHAGHADSQFSASLKTIMSSELARTRNALASLFLENQAYTHLLFVDSDMGFRPGLIAKMLAFKKPFVGVLTPKKRFNGDLFLKLAKRYDDAQLIERLATDFVLAGDLITDEIEEGRRKIRFQNGFIQASRTGTGVLLLERSVFGAIRDAHPELVIQGTPDHYKDCGISGPVCQYFAPMPDQSGEFIGEDLSFCRRWTETGGEVWLSVDEDISHVGVQVYTSAFIDRLKHGLF